MPTAFLDPACPIDWAHPLSRGLVAVWAVVPNSGWRGGLTLRDLVRGGRKPNDGTLTGGPTWAGAAGRPGGYGAVAFSGESQYVLPTIPSPAALGGTGSVAYWFRWRSGGNGGYQCNAATDSGALFNAGRSATEYPGGTFMGMSIGTVNGTPMFSVGYDSGAASVSASSGVPADTWTHVAGTYDGAALRVFLNGNKSATTTQAGSLTWVGTFGTLSAIRISRMPFGGDSSADGIYWYNNALSEGEVRALYDQSRRGNPDHWRWVTTRAYSVPAGGAAATGTPILRGGILRSSIIGSAA